MSSILQISNSTENEQKMTTNTQTQMPIAPELARHTSGGHLPLATEVVMAESVTHNKYLGNLFKKVIAYEYKMDFNAFVKIIRTGTREVSKNSVITYTRNLKRLAADIDAIGDVPNDWDNDNSFSTNLEQDVVGTALQMGIQLLANNASMLMDMSVSVRKARIAAVLVAIDPEREDKVSDAHESSVTFAQNPTGKNIKDSWSANQIKFKGKKPTNGDQYRYMEYVLALDDDADNKYKDEVEMNTKAKVLAMRERSENHDDGIHYNKDYRGEGNSIPGRSLAYVVPEAFWTAVYYKTQKLFDEPELADTIHSLRAFAVKEQKAYSAGVKTKSVKEDANWVSQKQIAEKATEMRTKLNDIFRKKDVEIPRQDKLKEFVVAAGKILKDEKAAEVEASRIKKVARLAKYKVELDAHKANPELEKPKKVKVMFGLAKKKLVRKSKKLVKQYWTEALPTKFTNKPFMSALINAFVAALYTDLPPRRLDWAKLHFISKNDFDKIAQDVTLQDGGRSDGIYYVFPNTKYGPNPSSASSFIVFGARAGKSQQENDLREDNIGVNIRSLGAMIYWIQAIRDPEEPVQGRSVVITNPGFTQIDENALGKRVKKIFSGKYGGVKKNITASLLRKIFITDEFKGDTDKKIRIAKLMNHSVKIQQAIYNKEKATSSYDGSFEGEPMTGEMLNQVESNQIPVDIWTKSVLHKQVVE
jgi:hypothetical protein